MQVSGKGKQRLNLFLFYFIAFCIAVIILAPMYIAIVYSLKTKNEIAFTGIAFPKLFHFENYIKAIEVSHFFNAAKNSLIVTVGVVLFLTFSCPMASYVVARGKGRIYSLIYYTSLAAILIPFQVVMQPLYKSLSLVSLMNTNLGLILAIAGFQIGYNIFIYTGFIKAVPLEIEESATLDGCSHFVCFWYIIFSLLRPIVATSIILNALTGWNEFPISLIIAQKDSAKTIPLSQYFFFGQYSSDLNLAFAYSLIALIPILILYVFMQKNIISGIMSGGIKG